MLLQQHQSHLHYFLETGESMFIVFGLLYMWYLLFVAFSRPQQLLSGACRAVPDHQHTCSAAVPGASTLQYRRPRQPRRHAHPHGAHRPTAPRTQCSRHRQHAQEEEETRCVAMCFFAQFCF